MVLILQEAMVTRWPKAEVQLDTDGGGIVNLSGITTEIREADTEAARSQVTAPVIGNCSFIPTGMSALKITRDPRQQ